MTTIGSQFRVCAVPLLAHWRLRVTPASGIVAAPLVRLVAVNVTVISRRWFYAPTSAETSKVPLVWATGCRSRSHPSRGRSWPARCTTAKDGRKVTVSSHEARLTRARANSGDPGWLADYRATRPKVERKIAHLMRRRHGGRRARMRGRAKIAADFSLLAAAVNLARLGVLAIMSTGCGTWAVAAG
jgi:hypothetical protein